MRFLLAALCGFALGAAVTVAHANRRHGEHEALLWGAAVRAEQRATLLGLEAEALRERVARLERLVDAGDLLMMRRMAQAQWVESLDGPGVTREGR